jgi:hypothetical protein
MTLPSITLTLTGASHLVGFSGFSAQEVRRVRFDRPGARVLVGPFHRQPEMNTPTAIRLKPATRTLLVAGRAFDRERDLFLPIVPSPGDRVSIPLTVPTPTPDLLSRLVRLFASVPWTFAQSYAGGDAEHYYSRREAWPSEQAFIATVTALQRYGYRNRFGGGWWQQLDAGDFTYWGGFERPDQHRWINRRELSRPPVPIAVCQTLIAEDARVLRLPAAPDRWRALAEELFGEEGAQ